MVTDTPEEYWPPALPGAAGASGGARTGVMVSSSMGRAADDGKVWSDRPEGQDEREACRVATVL